ncbi:probable LRR receptor-like serine/threonine-protein kinase At1g06840 isoform X2 [Hibiscus syriacus]|uniref:probable LRR receptor-like serine/threonine-protein kinase At1g06840 isoform X2 n=1 Tax=Hibiscus syriacus TaxID=106335 RepID=UPI0019213C99|nr:probable LRR receptor-like serine/threonine-protein kinase At1g06840 isoform X2 [Hibiscus syriacus]
MPTARVWSWAVGAVILMWLFRSSLLVGAQDGITHPAEVRALRAIRRTLVDNNKNLSNWNRGDPCTSNWTGVLCFNSTQDDGYLHVRELQLLNMNLSGSLSSELGLLSRIQILNFMWNDISGSIPKEIGNITSLELLLLNGNHLTGPLPEEIGYLPNLDRIQIDQNNISGSIPRSFANLNKTKHFHMNNNSISGQIPPELARLPYLVHFQLDNNNFEGTTIPDSYGNMSKLLKLSLRNCNLQGPIPDLSRIRQLGYLDLSSNRLNGTIPTNQLSQNITTIDLSNNELTGSIPVNFSGLPILQELSLANNSLNGSIPSSLWQNKTLNATESLIVDLENNMLTDILGSTNLPPNVTLWLKGNPVCSNNNLSLPQLCASRSDNVVRSQSATNSTAACQPQSCPFPFEYSPTSNLSCFCAAPLLVGYRLKSPGFSDFLPYISRFEEYLTNGLELDFNQLYIDSFEWKKGPRLKMYLKLYPVYNASSNTGNLFNKNEVQRIRRMFTGWHIPDSDIFGPYELLNFTLLDIYRDVFVTTSKSGISTGALIGIVLGGIAVAVTLSAVVTLLILRVRLRNYRVVSKRRQTSKSPIKIDGVKSFTYTELGMATNNFNSSAQVGQGGYGKVYRGTLPDGLVVAIKRAQEGSLQGEREFLTEIQLLSRLHHRNLVSLIGYCDEEGEQMLVYEFMSNGTLRDNLSAKSKEPMSFAMRLKIALGSAKGILYLHTEADPPIFHRDIKASNILLDPKFTAKVADFGLSRLAPVPDVEGAVPAHVSTVVKGTPGYLDPEYFLTHKLTDKSDVYSLGVVFLELLTGMQPISHGKNIVREVNVAYQSGMVFSVIDGRMGSYPSECVEKFLTLALKCCQEETDSRPSMVDVVREVENIWVMMPESNMGVSKSIDTVDEKMTPPPPSSSSSSMVKNPYVSSDVSGSDLVSGVIPSITPR